MNNKRNLAWVIIGLSIIIILFLNKYWGNWFSIHSILSKFTDEEISKISNIVEIFSAVIAFIFGCIFLVKKILKSRKKQVIISGIKSNRYLEELFLSFSIENHKIDKKIKPQSVEIEGFKVFWLDNINPIEPNDKRQFEVKTSPAGSEEIKYLKKLNVDIRYSIGSIPYNINTKIKNIFYDKDN